MFLFSQAFPGWSRRWLAVLILGCGILGTLPAQTFADVTINTFLDSSTTPATQQTVTYRMWVPDGVAKLRGILAVAPGNGGDYRTWANATGGDVAMQLVAQRHAFAVVGMTFSNLTSMNSGNLDNDAGFLETGIAALGNANGHPELATAPIANYGFSNGSGYGVNYARYNPARCIAFAHNKGTSLYEIDQVTDLTPARAVPGLVSYGENDTTRAPNIQATFVGNRGAGALWAMIPDYALAHDENGYSHFFGAVFLDRMIERRIPAGWVPGTAPVLTPLTEADGWLGDHATWDSATGDVAITPVPQSTATLAQQRTMSWLPDAYLANAWRAIVNRNKAGKLAAPRSGSSLSTGQFLSLAAGAGTNLTLAAGTTPASVTWKEGDAVLGSVATAPFTLAQKPGYGLHAFFGVPAGSTGTTDLAIVAVARGANQAPLVQTPVLIGPVDLTVGATATFQAQVSDPDGGLLNLLSSTWSATGPGAVSFPVNGGPGSVANATAVFPVAGAYVVTVTVTDAEGAVGTAQLPVTVTPNAPPLVNAGPDLNVALSDPVATVLAGTVRDDGLPASGVLSVAWSQVSGPGGAVFADPAKPVTAVTFPKTGSYVLRLTASDGGVSASDTLTVAVVGTPVITSSVAPVTLTTTGTWTYTIAGTDAPTQYSATGLPTGLTLNAATGVISGKPTVVGKANVILGATNAYGTGTAVLPLTITTVTGWPAITNGTLAQTATVGTAFSFTVTASGTPITAYSATGLPAGLAINASTGAITGTPTAAGIFPVLLGAKNAKGTGVATLTLTVNPASPVITSALAVSARVGVPFAYQITAQGSPTAFSATGLPPGLTVGVSTGLIAGTPTTPGSFPVALGATAGTALGGATLTITVVAPPVVTGPLRITLGQGVPANVVLIATGAPTTFTALDLPAGLSLSNAGVISGSPTAKGVAQVAITAGGATGHGTSVVTIVVLTPIEAFVSRFYEQCLNRTPDAGGLSAWSTALGTGAQSGVDVARGFILSQEFANRNLNDSDFLDVVYRAFFGRDPDAGGKAGWQSQLSAQVLREDVLYGFILSQEFTNLCQLYGITVIDAKAQNAYTVRQFVRRFYQQCLTREPDAAGIADWTDQLIKGTRLGADVARGFVLSQEFSQRPLSDQAYLTILYKAFFNRDPDAGGNAGWLAQLAAGKARPLVLDGFIFAAEFSALCAQYGIIPFAVGG